MTSDPTNAAPPGPLAYESSIPGALQPGERVLFECRPTLAAAAREPVVFRAMLVLVVTAMVAIAAASITSDATITIIAALLAALVLGLAVFVFGRSDRRLNRDLEHTTYRVNDRRVLSMDDRPGRAALEVHLTGLDRVQLARQRRGTTVAVGPTPFANLPDPAQFERAVVELCARSGRRRQIRRSPSHDKAASRINSAVNEQRQPTLPEGVTLAADEKVLWSGRPRVRENLDLAWLLGRLHIMAWLLVALAFLLSALGAFEPWVGRVHFFFGFAAAFLLLAGLYSLLVGPFVQAARRARTWYVLSNVRAIVHTRRGRRASVTDSYLLDVAGMTELKERSDGTGDVWISAGAMFERIENPREVHLLVLDAIRHAGTPITPPDMGDDELD